MVERLACQDPQRIARITTGEAAGDVELVGTHYSIGGRSNLVVADLLISHGVRVYFYPGMTHVKALLVDGWACMGSGNLDHLSLRLSQEDNIATSDTEFANRIRSDLFETDLTRSYELTNPLPLKMWDRLAALFTERM